MLDFSVKMLYNVLINKKLEKNMLKFEGILVGTTIKAYDFEPMEGRTDRYVTGPITGVTTRDGAKFYVITCEKDGALGLKTNRIGMEVYVPMEMFMDFDNRIIPLDGPCAPKSELIKKLADELGLPVIDLSLSK